tara:strand:- start:344 stop:1069 length:726 start_codon:yes stop_codon:yes gene_type:complete
MYFSERRKQGLGSLRPGYFLGGNIGNMLLGNAMNWGLGKATDYAFKSKEQRQKEKLERDMRKLGVYGYFPEGSDREEDDDTNKTSGFKGALGGGLMNLLATAVLGPLMGPLALTIGKGIMNKSKGLGFTGGSGGSGPGPKGPTGKNIDYYTGSDEEDKDNELETTGETTSDAGWTSAPSHIGPTGQDIHGGGDSGGRGTSSGSQNQTGHGSSGMGRDPSDRMATGGRVSYSQGGIASLWQR